MGIREVAGSYRPIPAARITRVLAGKGPVVVGFIRMGYRTW
jgi:hypothetical protein